MNRLLGWLLLAELIGGFLLVAWLAPASPRGSLIAASWTNSYQAMEPQYMVLSWISACTVDAIAMLLGNDDPFPTRPFGLHQPSQE